MGLFDDFSGRLPGQEVKLSAAAEILGCFWLL